MQNKTIVSIIAMLFIVISLIFPGASEPLIYFTIGIIATLGGISIYKNGHPKIGRCKNYANRRITHKDRRSSNKIRA